MKIAVLLLVILVNCAHQALSSQGGNNYGIFGGKDATEGQFPYQAAIYACSRLPLPGLHCDQLCGGTVISPSWIVTAAPCYKTSPYYYVDMYATVGYVDVPEDDKLGYYFKSINQTIVHDDYLPGEQASNDIRLYQLKKPLTFTELIQPAKLPKQNSDFTGAAVTSGWGYINNEKNNFPDVLQYQISNMPNGERCAELADAAYLKNFNVARHVCTENPEQGKGTCSTDIGGPLVQNGTLVGITSWNFTYCGVAGVPSVFTRVSNYIDWITDRVTEPLLFN